ILLALDAALQVVPPGRGPPQRVGDALESATFAPLEQGTPVERVGAPGHLPDAIVFKGRLTPGAVLDQSAVQPYISELFNAPIRESDLGKAIQVIVLKL